MFPYPGLQCGCSLLLHTHSCPHAHAPQVTLVKYLYVIVAELLNIVPKTQTLLAVLLSLLVFAMYFVSVGGPRTNKMLLGTQETGWAWGRQAA